MIPSNWFVWSGKSIPLQPRIERHKPVVIHVVYAATGVLQCVIVKDATRGNDTNNQPIDAV